VPAKRPLRQLETLRESNRGHRDAIPTLRQRRDKPAAGETSPTQPILYNIGRVNRV
jgi:hypothetical protein